VVVIAWLLGLVLMSVVSKAVGTAYSNSFDLPNTESTKAIDLLQSAAPKQAGDTDTIVVGTSGAAKVTDPAVRSRVEAMLKEVAQLPTCRASCRRSPGGRRPDQQDGIVAFATVTLTPGLISRFPQPRRS
jgi:RND superfamily putative drug exporter